MTPPRSLGRLLLIGATAFAAAGGVVMIGIIVLFGSLQRDVERDASARLAEQHAADDIMTSVYGQILASYQQLQAPSEQNLERFDALGQTAYSRLRLYLFQSMPVEARLQVETIKELHQALEVEAHGAFDLITLGESAAARARVTAMQRQAELLQAEMGRFLALRDQERAQRHEEQVALFQRVLLAITLVGLALGVVAILFVRLVQRRVVAPLGQLAEAAVRLGRGDLAGRIPPQRYDELETVGRRFNEMADHVRETRTEIEDQNIRLGETIQHLKKSQQDLVQQEKLGAIGLMLAGLAHELNNPLAGILGTAEVIEGELADHSDPAVRRVVDEFVLPLIKEAGRAGDLVRNLLQFSRQSSAQVGAVNLKTAIDVSAGLRAYAFAQAGRELQIDVPGTLFVAVEAQRLEHVVMNIMSNALDAMSTGGGTKLVIRAKSAGTDRVSVIFEDDGPGFLDPDRVFDAFYTTKPVGTGTGLGLSLVQRFVDEAGGTIAADNVPSGGARLTIQLRAATAPEADGAAMVPEAAEGPDAPMASSFSEQPGGERRILIVDDEPALRHIQRRVLERLGMEVLVASDGAEAIAILQRERVDAVITDIRMPGEVDGIALYNWIELTRPELAGRCLFVTGAIEPGREGTVIGAHPEWVITKPFRRAEYVARVMSILESASASAR